VLAADIGVRWSEDVISVEAVAERIPLVDSAQEIKLSTNSRQ